MKKLFLCAGLYITAILVFAGCAANVRYTPEEIKDYTPAVQEQIRQGEVAIGMSTNQVRYSLGSPATVNVLSPTHDGKPKEEWIYSSLNVFMKRRLLFIDGKLADIFPEMRKANEKKSDEKKPDVQK